MKTCILILSLLLSLSALAATSGDARISNELATVKACDATLHQTWYKDFDLSKVTEAAAVDTGKSISVTLKFKANIEVDGKLQSADCQSYSWYSYDGTPTGCPMECPEGLTCSCPTGMCESPAGRITFR